MLDVRSNILDWNQSSASVLDKDDLHSPVTLGHGSLPDGSLTVFDFEVTYDMVNPSLFVIFHTHYKHYKN